MPLPAAWDTRQVKGTRLDFLGSPAVGTISFTPTAQRIKDIDSDAIIFAKAVVATLQTDGTFLVTLPVSVGDIDVVPNFQYNVLEQFVGAPDYRYAIEIPMELSDADPFDIADLAPTGSVPTGTTALTQAVADLLYQSLSDLASHAHIHIQSIPATVWDITHSLLFYPSVTVVDSAGSVVEGDIQYLSDSSVRLTFVSAFSGTAYLS